jgi:prepilin-type N-terminal cleavage/methylation domain-containing protein
MTEAEKPSLVATSSYDDQLSAGETDIGARAKYASYPSIVIKVLQGFTENTNTPIPVSEAMANRVISGFTLAELLIALAILGVIATFTIPKILSAQQNSSNNAIAKEALSAVSAAFQQYSIQNGLSSSTSVNAITQYLNYVAVDSTTTVDDSTNSSSTFACSAVGLNRCLKLHNGAILVYHNGESFSGTGATNGIWFLLDPDGMASSNKGLVFFVLYNGRVSSEATMSSITSSVTTYTTGPDPSWFSW